MIVNTILGAHCYISSITAPKPCSNYQGPMVCVDQSLGLMHAAMGFSAYS